MKDTLHFIVASIVENADAVTIEESEQDDMTVFTVSVAKEDMGKVIGKEGKVIKAIRNVMRVPGVLQSKKIYITLAEV